MSSTRSKVLITAGISFFLLVFNLLFSKFVGCPGTRVIRYNPAPHTRCQELGGAHELKYNQNVFFPKACVFHTCEDLRHRLGHYCGNNCSWIGSHCNGCIQLDNWGLKVISGRKRDGKSTYLSELFEIKFAEFIDKYSDVSVGRTGFDWPFFSYDYEL